MVAEEFGSAADCYADTGSRPDEAFVHLRAAGQLLGVGHRAEANLQVLTR